jgi:dihydroorotase
MRLLVKQATVIDPSSPFHQQSVDILIDNGRISAIGSVSSSADKTLEFPDLHVSPGWLDPFAHFCDPGLEFRETVRSGAEAAAAGGFTDVMVLPNTQPVVHSKSGVEYLVTRSGDLPVSLFPIGAVTRNTEGKELAEMYDMHASGAIAFGDGTSPIQSAGLMMKALQYLKAIDANLIQLPGDKSVNATGLMNEGRVSTSLGLPGMPAIAEELMVQRDIELTEYTGSRLHLTGISSAKSTDLIRDAKKKGIRVTCSVSPFHLCYSDEDLAHYDTNLKLNPPLRTKEDREALRKGILDGTIDCIASHHIPLDTDHKVVEFEYAGFGALSLETSFAIVRSCLPHIKIEDLVALFCWNPRKIFGLPKRIEENSGASLTLFQPDASFSYHSTLSVSRNSPLLGKTLTGRVVGILNKERLFLNPL